MALRKGCHAMYVCLCNALTDQHVRTAAQAGANRPSEIYRACGCAVRCGTCSVNMRRILNEAAATAPQPDLLAAD
jgi:bacterioferritin-associated ferredoxin